MNFDLHTHSNCSDGALSPNQLLERAVERGVDVIAITDHDTVDAYQDGQTLGANIRLIPGIEFSTSWYSTGIHIVGLNIDPASAALQEGVRRQTAARIQRAETIGEKLQAKGIDGAFEGAQALAGGRFIGRPHFAEYLVNANHVGTLEMAYKKYLGDGKAGDVRQHWADLPQVIDWIRDAGGIAVLAHPLKYKFTRTRLKRFLNDFVAAGGEGMEVISGQQSPQQSQDMGRLCREKGLLGSRGSDFHRPGLPWSELGAVAPLPDGVIPVWDRF